MTYSTATLLTVCLCGVGFGTFVAYGLYRLDMDLDRPDAASYNSPEEWISAESAWSREHPAMSYTAWMQHIGRKFVAMRDMHIMAIGSALMGIAVGLIAIAAVLV